MNVKEALRHFRATALWLASFAVLAIGGLIFGNWVAPMIHAAPVHTPPVSASVPAADEDTYRPDYRAGAWHVGPTTVPLDCPEEDSCTVRYDPGEWVFVIDPGH